MTLGLSGKLKTLLDRLTEVRASYLDATISSRAPGSTALTNVTWTDTRAAKIDSILTDTAELVADCNAILVDTAYMQPRINDYLSNCKTYSGVRNMRYGEGTSTVTDYKDFTMSAITSTTKCIVSVNGGKLFNSAHYGGTAGQVTSTTNVRVHFAIANSISANVGYNLTEMY